MENNTEENKTFSSWAARTYSEKKEAIDFLQNSLDPFEKAIGVLIKRYSEGETNE